MNPAYFQARFRAELPHGGLPESFGIVTACNPGGKTAGAVANTAAMDSLRDLIESNGWVRFPVTGGSPDFQHAEPGFGILAELDDCLALGRVFRQEAIFWVERGQVYLYEASSHAGGPCWGLKPWAEHATGPAAHPAFHFRGPPTLLDAPATVFFSSTRCDGDAILAAHAWAREQCDRAAAVISGFHTPVERDVYAILARRGAFLIHCLARSLPHRLAPEQQTLLAQGRLLLLTPFAPGIDRATRQTCAERNRFAARLAGCIVTPQLAPTSSLVNDLAGFAVQVLHTD